LKKLGFIGTGNMGGALILAAAKSNSENELLLSDKIREKADALAEKTGGKVCGNVTVAAEADYIFLGVKPQVLRDLLSSVSETLYERTDVVLISMAAGIEIETITDFLNREFPIIRIMPNLPVAVAQGMTLYSPCRTSEEDVSFFENMMSNTGKILKLPENLIDAACSVSGCGPAFVCMIIEAMADGGVKCGLSRQVALDLAIQTLIGTSKYLDETQTHPAVLKDAVCSPAGSTIAGVEALENFGLRSCLMEGIIASFERNKELGR
jgi:pyrroline-5-carboxylate reductase